MAVVTQSLSSVQGTCTALPPGDTSTAEFFAISSRVSVPLTLHAEPASAGYPLQTITPSRIATQRVQEQLSAALLQSGSLEHWPGVVTNPAIAQALSQVDVGDLSCIRSLIRKAVRGKDDTKATFCSDEQSTAAATLLVQPVLNMPPHVVTVLSTGGTSTGALAWFGSAWVVDVW